MGVKFIKISITMICSHHRMSKKWVHESQTSHPTGSSTNTEG